MKNKFLYISLSMAVVMVLAVATASFAASVPRMSTDELKERLSEEDGVDFEGVFPGPQDRETSDSDSQQQSEQKLQQVASQLLGLAWDVNAQC